ncbi:MAG: glycosyltransferase family 39 protein [Chloroflexota bacterium]|nr:glycosyltransferase family 39 protein [Chloroflexota bacterium]
MSSDPLPHKMAHAACLLLVLAGFILRLAPLGRYVTPDEPNWVYRSVSFHDAVASGDWSAIPPTGHPGATTMWLGTAGIAVHRLLSPAESARHLAWIRNLAWLDPESGEAFRHLAFFLPGGRVAVALVTSLGLVVLFLLLSRLSGHWVALVTLGLLAFDPFLIGHSGLLHTDALLTTFGFLALVAALNGLRRPRQAAWWPLAGVCAGLALLTKSPALMFVGFVLVLLALRALRSIVERAPTSRSWAWAVAHGLLFVVSLAVTFSVFHPGVWADPVGTFQRSFSLAGRHMTSVQHPVFFAGETVLDPGPGFYPVVLLFRISPLVLLGLVAGWVRFSSLHPHRRLAFLALQVFAVLFTLGISLSTKKHDRYLLPVFPPLTLAAALGAGALLEGYGGKVATLLGSSAGRSARLPACRSGALLIILLQAVVALASVAYPLLYYNPLLGGLSTASGVVPTGWGERWGAAARRLNQEPGADQLSVAVSSVPSFAPLFSGRTLSMENDEVSLADYVVGDSPDGVPTGLAAWETLDVPARRRPTTIYENVEPLEQADWLDAHVEPGDLILLDADAPLQRRYSGPAELLSAHSLPDELALTRWLSEHVPGHDALWLVGSPGASPITAEHVRRQLETVATPVSTTTVVSSMITKLIPRSGSQVVEPAAYRASFGGRLALVDGSVPESVSWPQSLEVTLRWRALLDSGTDHQAVIVLRSDDGYGWASHETPVRNEVNFPTSSWSAGEWSDAAYSVQLPPDVPPGRYSVEASLFDGDTGARLGAIGPDGAFQGTRVPVAEVTVTAPSEPPDVAELSMGRGLDVSAGPLGLIGMNPPSERVLSGDTLSLDLFWQADAVPEADYRLRFRLVSFEDEEGSEFAEPVSSYPTSRWRVGDRFRSHHGLHIVPSVPPGRWQLMLNVLDEEGDSLWQQDRTLATVEVVPRPREFTLPEEIPHPMDVTFGQAIHLRGCSVPRASVGPGETIPLILYWQADGPTERSYTLFVHLVDPQGELAGQVDRVPGGGAAPTSSWAEGQVIVEEIPLAVAADAGAGPHRIAVGFYDAAYGKRLFAVDADGHVLPQDRALLPVEVEVVR